MLQLFCCGLACLVCRRQLASVRIALFEPEIAGNVGAILRLGACLGAAVDLIEPMGFEWDDRRVRRTAMDYIDHVTIVRHASFDAFRATIQSGRLVLFHQSKPFSRRIRHPGTCRSLR